MNEAEEVFYFRGQKIGRGETPRPWTACQDWQSKGDIMFAKLFELACFHIVNAAEREGAES